MPLCTACQYGKQRHRPSPGIKREVVHDQEGALKQGDLFPGQKIPVDHFVCLTRGCLSNTYSKENPKTQYCGGAIFIDHASGYLSLWNKSISTPMK